MKKMTRSELSRHWQTNRQAVSRLFQRPGAPAFGEDNRIAVDLADAWREVVKTEQLEVGKWRRELYRLKAALLEREIEIETGKLIPAADVARVAREDAAAIRTSLLAMPDTLAPLLTAQSSPERVRAILDDWARGTLQGWHDSLTE